MTQGPIADRSTEALSRSDKGIILYRHLLEEQVGIIESGRDPMNVFRDPTKNIYLHLPTEKNWSCLYIRPANRSIKEVQPDIGQQESRTEWLD